MRCKELARNVEYIFLRYKARYGPVTPMIRLKISYFFVIEVDK